MKTFFKVSVNDVALHQVIHRDASTSLSPYITFNFADFKHFQTSVRSSGPGPRNDRFALSRDFFYNTSFAHKLDVKYLCVEVLSKNRVFQDDLLGTAQVSLAELASGAQDCHLLLRDEEGHPAGHVTFSLEMVQILKRLQCTFAQTTVQGWMPSVAGAKYGSKVRLEYALSTMMDAPSVVSSELDAMETPYWMDLPWLEVGEINLHELLDASLKFSVVVSTASGIDQVYGTAVVPFMKHYQVRDDPIPFKVPVVNVNGQRLGPLLQGTLTVLRGPMFAQMRGSRVDGVLNTGDEVFCPPDRLPPPTFPLPPRVNPELPPHFREIQAEAAIVYEPHAPTVEAPQPYVPAPDASSSSRQTAVAEAVVESTVLPPFQARPREWRLADDILPCPRNWSIRKDPRGRAFFRFHPRKKTSWQDARFLPEGWEQRISGEGKLYFACSSLAATTWEDPRGMPDDWEMTLDVSVVPPRSQFVHKESGHVLDKDPRGLPHGFTQKYDAKRGRVYFQNHVTRTTQWMDPRVNMPLEVRVQWRDAYMTAWWHDQLQAVEQEHEEKQRREAAENARAQAALQALEEDMNSAFESVHADRERWLRQAREEWKLFEQSRSEYEHSVLEDLEREVEQLKQEQERREREWEEEFMRRMARERQKLHGEFDEETSRLQKRQEPTRKQMARERESWRHEFEVNKAKQLSEQTLREEANRRKLQASFDKRLAALQEQFPSLVS